MSGSPASRHRSSLERLGLTPETRWLQEKREKYDWSAVKETPGVYSLGHGATDIASEESTASIIARMIAEYEAACARKRTRPGMASPSAVRGRGRCLGVENGRASAVQRAHCPLYIGYW